MSSVNQVIDRGSASQTNPCFRSSMNSKINVAQAINTTLLVEPLSPREIEVLELLASGLTNLEITQRLFISLPTVKSHARNIYGKLGVHNRTTAVNRARELGILSS